MVLLCAPWHAPVLPGQGMVSHGAKAVPRNKLSGKVFPVSFTDIAARAGLTAPIIRGGEKVNTYLYEAMGTGVAFVDFDNDGWQDLFLVNGSRLEGFPEGKAPTNHLYRNNRDGTFTDVTLKAGLARSGWGMGVAVADYDNDGFEDLFVTYWSQNVLFRNNGDGTFADVTEKAGLRSPRPRWGSGSSFFDYDRDGDLDLFVANYVDFNQATTPKPGQNPSCTWLGLPVVCGPRGLPYATHILYRNNGNGTFTDVSAESGIAAAQKTYGLGVLAADFDGDGWQDVYVACDSTPSILFRNNRDGTFTNIGIQTGLAYDDNGMEQAGMGIALGDYNLDGLPDVAKTNFVDDYPNLYRNLGKGVFEDVSLKAGLGVNPQYVYWGVVFADVDNDFLPDLFIAPGHMFPEVAALKSGSGYRNPRLLYWNLGTGDFEDVSDRAGPGIMEKHCSRGAAAGDFDNDGSLDLLVMNTNEPPSLLRNENKSGNNWLKVKLTGTKSNRSAIGAVVRAVAGGRQQAAVVLSQSGYLSAGDRRVHFGLGKAPAADLIEIRWPSGLVETYEDVKANRTLEAVEGSRAEGK